VVSCAQLAAVPVLGRCPAGATAAAFPTDGFARSLDGVDVTGITWPAASVPDSRLDSLAVDAIDVATNGTGHRSNRPGRCWRMHAKSPETNDP
jgi:hypothetical protein